MPDLSVLIVDDHPVIRDSLDAFVTATAGLTVWGTAASGPDALARLEATSAEGPSRADGPSVVVADVQTPGMDGLALVAGVHARWPALPCVVFSAQRSQNYAQRAVAAGAAGYVEKSDLDGLVRTIRRVAAS